jgi:hypothetical protein
MFTMTHGKYISAAIMFRRGLQIIAKDILGAEGCEFSASRENHSCPNNLSSLLLKTKKPLSERFRYARLLCCTGNRQSNYTAVLKAKQV